ncbi:unnamed protein product, partial [Rotaria sp. Silwood2]
TGDNTITVILGNSVNSLIGIANFPTGINPRSVVVEDFDRENNSDFVVVNSGDNDVTVLIGDGVDTIIKQQNFSTGLSPQSVALGDFNHDNNPDIIVKPPTH